MLEIQARLRLVADDTAPLQIFRTRSKFVLGFPHAYGWIQVKSVSLQFHRSVVGSNSFCMIRANVV